MEHKIGFINGEITDVVFSIYENKFYPASIFIHDLVKKYNGEYSGGVPCDFATLRPGQHDDLLIFSSHILESRCVGYTHNGKKILGYIPTDDSGEIDPDHPAVLVVNNELVIFCFRREILDYLRALYTGKKLPIPAKEDSMTYYDPFDKLKKKQHKIMWSTWGHFDMLQPRKWLNLLKIKPGASGDVAGISCCSGPYYNINDKLIFTHVNDLGIIDKIWNSNPFAKEGELMDGWYSTGDGFVFRRENVSTVQVVAVKVDEEKGWIYTSRPLFYNRFKEDDDAFINIIDWSLNSSEARRLREKLQKRLKH